MWWMVAGAWPDALVGDPDALDGEDAGYGADDGLEGEALERGAEGEGVGAEVAGQFHQSPRA